jgi:hypothetical protein
VSLRGDAAPAAHPERIALLAAAVRAGEEIQTASPARASCPPITQIPLWKTPGGGVASPAATADRPSVGLRVVTDELV